jgi:uncharacterized protein (DUF1330 family)
MTASGTLEPTAAQIERLVAAAAADREAVVMINLLRFKDRADGIDAEDGISGAEAYGRYAAVVGAHLERVGAQIQLALNTTESVIGPDDDEWDMVIAVRYPSRQAFLEMTSNPDYLKIHGHRTAALADSRLIACAPLGT